MAPPDKKTLWQLEAERIGGSPLVELLDGVQSRQTAILDKMVVVERASREMSKKLDNVMTAFPGGDADGHRRYHESVIEWQELRNKLVREALLKMVGASVVVAGGWLCYAVWTALKMSVVRQ